MTSNQDDVAAALAAAQDAANRALATSADAAAGTGLVPTGADAALAVKAQMAGAHASVAKARKAALEQVASAKAAIKAQQDELDRQARELERMMEPLAEQLALMTEGIKTMNLYLGRDEEIVQLADGEPAPAGTPIHVRQLVLAMDEETAINAEGNGIDVDSIDLFDQWVTSDPSHLDQVLPEVRGVVAIMARRKDVDYKDPWTNAQKNAANHHTYFLIRNGQRLYRMDTEFEVGKRLVPARNEFTSFFVDPFTKEPLRPGTDAWIKAEKKAGARERHFMRVALLLQGLIDRTRVFHPLPKVGVSLLTPDDYDNGHVVLIADDENQIGTGRVPFREWLRALNAQLRPGMRVMLTTNHHRWPRRSSERHSYGEHDRIHPPQASWPKQNVPHVIKRRGTHAGEFVITYPRTDEVWVRGPWGGGEYRTAQTPASCTLTTSDEFVLPIDLVDIPTMRAYLSARTERHAYADMFPTLLAAIELLEAEAAAEAPFRDLLAAQVAQAEDVDLDTAAALVDPVIRTWKVGARWFRPMTGDPAAEAKAAKAILAERARIAAADAGSGDDAAFLAQARREHPDALLVARKKDSTYVVLTPAKRAWTVAWNRKEQLGLPTDVWVHQHEYTRTGKHRRTAHWVIPALHTVSRWIALHEDEKLATWQRAANAHEHLTDPEITGIIGQIRERSFEGLDLLAISYDETSKRWSNAGRMEFDAWYHPGAPEQTDRPLTRPIRSLEALKTTIVVTKDRSGALTLAWDTDGRYARPITDGRGERWTKPYRWHRDPEPLMDDAAPWADNNDAQRIVWLDDAVMATATRQHHEVLAAKEIATTLDRTVRVLMDSIQEQWITGAVESQRQAFMDDYADEELWQERAAKLRETIRLPWRGHDAEMRPWYGIRNLVQRLVESDRTPWGATVGEALAILGEDLNPNTGAIGFHQNGREKEHLDEPLSDDLLALRFATEPTGTDIALREDA